MLRQSRADKNHRVNQAPPHPGRCERKQQKTHHERRAGMRGGGLKTKPILATDQERARSTGSYGFLHPILAGSTVQSAWHARRQTTTDKRELVEPTVDEVR